MAKLTHSLLLATGLIALAPLAQATSITFDFTTVSSDAFGDVGSTSVNVNGIVATGYSNSLTNPADLWKRNNVNDHGLGVCSEGHNACVSGGGDVNELSNQMNNEAIVLDNTNGGMWTSLWVSSLDSGGSHNNESGLLYWGNTLGSWDGSFSFSYADLNPAVEGDILALAPSNFGFSAKYLMFTNNSENGSNNDYVVWKGAVETVPEPAPLALLGLGLLSVLFFRRKRIAVH